MAAVGAWDCPVCGGLRFTAEGSEDPLLASYAKPHVCEPSRVAEKRYMDDPRVSLDDAVPGMAGSTYADVLL